MRGKAAKEIRKFLKETQPNLLKPESKALYKKIYKRVKNEYKATPWNKKDEVIVK
jgi:hypothetical protein